MVGRDLRAAERAAGLGLMGTPFDPEEVLALPLMAVLSSASEKGPRGAPVWYQWEEGALWMLSDAGASSARRIAGDPRVAVEIVDYDLAAGVLRHLGLRGRASVEPSDPARFRRLLARYLGPDPVRWNHWFVANVAKIDDPSGRMIRLEPSSVFTNDVSFFRTGPELARR